MNMNISIVCVFRFDQVMTLSYGAIYDRSCRNRMGRGVFFIGLNVTDTAATITTDCVG